jgi:hypothetical protein
VLRLHGCHEAAVLVQVVVHELEPELLQITVHSVKIRSQSYVREPIL